MRLLRDSTDIVLIRDHARHLEGVATKVAVVLMTGRCAGGQNRSVDEISPLQRVAEPIRHKSVNLLSKEESNMAKSLTANLVSSSDVNGTEVYARDGTKIGSIDHLMIDKQSGKVAYAVMGFGGFLGMGEDHHPVPWGKLTYDAHKNGFVTDITESELKGAPTPTANWYADRDWEHRVHRHYEVPFYWA